MFRLLVLILVLEANPSRAAAAPPDVDLEPLLAVDTSGSMDPGEARVQRLGYLEALRMSKTAQLSVSCGLAQMTRGTNITVNAVLPIGRDRDLPAQPS